MTHDASTPEDAIDAPPMTFHALMCMAFEMHLARTGQSEDELAADMATNSGTTWTGDDLRRFRVEGFPSTFHDAGAYRVGITGIEAVAYLLQLAPPPHRSCASCTCGVAHADRRHIARVFLTGGDEAAARTLATVRRRQSDHRERQKSCGVDTQTA